MPSNNIAQRAKDHLPTVLLTLLSIVQALALELIWSYMMEHDTLYHWSFANVIVWLQIAATLLGILLIWLSFSGIIMRFRWVPTTGDSVFPFLIGIVEFFQITRLGIEHLGQWLLILALIFAVVSWVNHHCLRRARLDGDNDAYFRTMSPAQWRDHLPVAVIVGVFILFGLVLWVSGHTGWFALLAILIATALLAYQLWLHDKFWKLSIAVSD